MDWQVKSRQWAAIREKALPMLEGLSEWQVYYYRPGDNTWSNAQSGGGANAPARPGSAPDEGDDANISDSDFLPAGIRLVLKTPSGTVQRDILMQTAN
jgi:hypothetical protein